MSNTPEEMAQPCIYQDYFENLHKRKINKTPEEMAKEWYQQMLKSGENPSGDKCFIAGFRAGEQRTDIELLKIYLDMRYNESFGMKIAVFINGLRKGLKVVKNYEKA
jgi:hypothetical protein